MSAYSMGMPSIAVLISGNGSNLQAIIDAIDHGDLTATIAVVISNRADAYGLARAQRANIPTEVLSHQDYETREAYDEALKCSLEKYQPKLIVLAGFMRILTPSFVKHFQGRILNIHPSLLPKYPGLHTHQQVLANNDPIHGATVHMVTSILDSGPIVGHMQCDVTPEDTEETLRQRVQQLEHQLYPKVIREFLETQAAPRTPAIVIQQLTLGYPGHLVIEHFSSTINTGTFLGIFGPNGAGKTTFLQSLLGLMKPLHGTISILGENPHTGCRKIGYVPQNLPQLNVPVSGRALLQSGILGTRLGVPALSKTTHQQIEQVLQLTNTQDYADRPFMQLSGGEKRRLLVAQALLSEPKILLLDEPLANVDPSHQHILVQLLDQIRKTLNITVLLTAHDINPLLKVMTNILYLAEKKAMLGTIPEVIRSDVLTELYGTPIEVIHHDDKLFIMHCATGKTHNVGCYH